MKKTSETKGKKNLIIASILEHLAGNAARPEEIDLWPAIRERAAAQQAHAQPRTHFSNRRLILPVVTVVVTLLAVMVWLARTPTSVSAQQILARAAAAQSLAATQSTRGIIYTRTEDVVYPNALKGDRTAHTTIHESYYDYQAGRLRWDFIDGITGRVQDVFSYDGLYTWDADQSSQRYVDGVLTVYHAIEDESGLVKVVTGGGDTSARQIFEMQANLPNVTLKSHETRADGREVYILSMPGQRVAPAGKADQSSETTLSVFDARTYQLIETQTLKRVDGKDILIGTTRTLAQETIADGSQVPWDLHDLKGIHIVDASAEDAARKP